LENAWVSVFPFVAEPQGVYSFDAFLGSQEIQQRLVGAWWVPGGSKLCSLFSMCSTRS
jgi:hypothetical protein